MNTEATKAVNDLIVNLCEYINMKIKSNSVEDHKQLPSLLEALGKLTN
ncbi:hypothetical protein [Paenibacillus sp. FSL H7-0326]|nr:hypothetical protein [Paenibacillus sp. FSL H7-0326]